MILLDCFEDKKYGKVAHFINENDESVFSRVVEADGTIIYEELPEEEQKEYLKKVFENIESDIYESQD